MLAFATLASGVSKDTPAKAVNRARIVHSVSDLAHEFSFYTDGRFAGQYLNGHKDVRNWGNLYGLDVSNANLINLLGCDSRVKYNAKDIQFLNKFMTVNGGGVLVAFSPGNEGMENLLKEWGVSSQEKAQPPFSFARKEDSETIDAPIVGGQSPVLKFDSPKDWTVIVEDAEKRPIVAMKKVGKGRLLVIPRNMLGSRPDASDPHNAEWVSPLLVEASSGKRVSDSKPLSGNGLTSMGNEKKVGTQTYYFSDYLEPYFEVMAKIDAECRPLIQKRMGVPLSKGMASGVGLLATDGGGFSSGPNVGLAVFWEDFPKVKHGMIEFLTHESVHSWVLPHPEVWNEPIATYVGDLVMGDAGFKEEGDRRIAGVIERASRIDPTMKLYDLNGEKSAYEAPDLDDGQKNDIHWGKTFWVFEELRKQDPDFMAKYFQVKRKYVPAALPEKYSIHDTVALLSVALGKDLYPWFNEHGIKADPAKKSIRVPLIKKK